jgi:antitoxin VapB
MSASAKVFMNGRSQAIRLPKEFRVTTSEVRLTQVPGGILISEPDPWKNFAEGSLQLSEEFFAVLDNRDRATPQKRNFTAGM